MGWWPRERLANLALAGSSLVLALGGAEGALRLADYNYTPLSIRAWNDLADRIEGTRADGRLHHAFEDEHFTYDSRLIWRPRAGHSVFNSQGYRGPELARRKAPGEVRVLAIGDSNTLGWARRTGANWPGLLGELLAQSEPAVRVVNAGVYGYTIFQGFRRLEEALDLAPDVVLVSFGSNDAHQVVLPDREFSRVHPGSLIPALSRFKVAQLLFAFSDRWTVRPAEAGAELQSRVPLAEHRAYLVRIAELGEARGFLPVFLTRPYLGQSDDVHYWKHRAPDYRRLTIEVAAERGIPLIDLYESFRWRQEYFADESHFTALGHRVAAKQVYDALASLLVERSGLAPGRLLPAGSGFPARLELDLRNPATRDHLERGLSWHLEKGRGLKVRSRGEDSAFALLLAPVDTDYQLVIEARVVRGAHPLAVSVRVNRQRVGAITLRQDPARYPLMVPRRLLGDGLNRIELRYEGVGARRQAAASATEPLVLFESLVLEPRAE